MDLGKDHVYDDAEVEAAAADEGKMCLLIVGHPDRFQSRIEKKRNEEYKNNSNLCIDFVRILAGSHGNDIMFFPNAFNGD